MNAPLPPELPMRRRLQVIGAIVLVTFLFGTAIFHSLAHGEIAKYYLAAIMLFPGGFVILGLGKASAPVGWTVYAACLGAMLAFSRRKPFLITCCILIVLIVVNLFGCGVMLKG